MSRLVWSFALLWTLIGNSVAVSADFKGEGIQAKDLVDGYRLNFQRFKTLRVTWRVTSQRLNEWFLSQEYQVQRAEYLARKGASEVDRKRRLAEAERLRRQLDYARQHPFRIVHMDFWTDRRRFQMRTVPSDDAYREQVTGEKITENYSFPNVALDIATLPTAFNDIEVLSFNGDLNLGFRWWAGPRRREGIHTAAIHKTSPMNRKSPFPPLGVDTEVWGPADSWHLIDQFFQLPVDNMTVKGSEAIAGKKTYRLQYRKVDEDTKKFLGPELAELYAGKVEQIDLTTAWIDAQQGFLPLKIEWVRYIAFKDVDKPPPQPQHRLAVDRIEHIPEGGYYPVKGVVQDLNGKTPPQFIIPSPDVMQPILDYWKGKNWEIPPVPHQEMGWETKLVEANREMDPKMFDLPFPSNTMVVDQLQQKPTLTGSPDDMLDAAIRDNGEPTAPPVVTAVSTRWRLGLLLVNIVLFSAVLGFYIFKRYRRKRS